MSSDLDTTEYGADAALLSSLLMAEDPYRAILDAVEDGTMKQICPEFLDLALDIPDTHDHKDVVKHTALVVAKTAPRLRPRLCSFFHDIGKPATRRLLPDGTTTFHNHEAVGASIAKRVMLRMGFPEDLTHQVSKMVRMSGRSKDAWSWSDAAVRRFTKEASDCMYDLFDFYRCDTTTRYARKRELIRMKVDAMEKRCLELMAEDARKDSFSPVLDGYRVMEYFGLEPGPEVGEAVRLIRDAQEVNPDLTEQEALALLEEQLFQDPDD